MHGGILQGRACHFLRIGCLHSPNEECLGPSVFCSLPRYSGGGLGRGLCRTGTSYANPHPNPRITGGGNLRKTLRKRLRFCRVKKERRAFGSKARRQFFDQPLTTSQQEGNTPRSILHRTASIPSRWAWLRPWNTDRTG